ncbi:hypothetical protein LBLM1_10930 (plasmid) [Limosilactobacillus mucosae LM1]|uniref:Gp58-like domain-containing protein n=1 Tax=Limosilactobacillus mucosae LM1 TaxID=1130798 RepID=A0A0D4CN45_LIMMU|nr:hypothetical protein [Limosilactobacillus mucosae]AJT51542.1 hypothetical protein LBLM1_10930 [Limosilactobacillus mucosae LM1]
MLSTKLSSTDLDPLKTSIQNQETEIQQTKDSIATKAGKAELDVLSGRVSTAESKIKQQADEISLGVKKSELNGAIDNYQVEGTNRLRDTIDFDIDNGYWKLDQYSINSNTDVHPYDQAHDVSALVLQKTGSAKQDVDFTNEDLGNSFVISMWNKKDAQPQLWYGNTQLTNRQVADIKGDYERSFFTFIPTDANVKTIMFKYDAGTVDQLVIGEPKLELGTKPKAYAPNPNDEHKQIVNTKAELKIASDKIESTVEKQTKTDNNINQLSSRVTQTEQGITATNDLITKTKDGLIKDYTGKINASAKSLSSEFDEKTDEKIGQITDSGENLILNSAFTNETDRKDKWQNISDKVNIVDDGNGLMWAKMSQSGLTTDNPISLTSNYFPIKQGKITVGVDIKSDNTNGLSGAKTLVLQTYNANKQRVDFTELTLENMGLTIQQLADGQSHRGVYRLGNDRSDAVYMTVKAVLPRNGSIYFTNFSAKLSSIDNGGYTPNAEDLKRQILNQKTKIEQNSQQIILKASSTELRDVRTIANGAVSSATNANNNASSAMNTANTANTNATNAASVANTANNKANSATTVANQANSNANQAVTTANSANSKINDIQTQIDQARTDIQSTLTVANNGITAATNLKTTYDNYVQKNDANIKLLGDRITNEVSKITSNGGGRNLLIGTSTATGDVAGGNGDIVKGAFNGYDAVKTNTAWDERMINLQSALGRTNAKAGDWFTLSVYVKADKQINTGSLNIYRALGNGGAEDNDGFLNEIPMQDKPITTQWQQYSWSFQINNVSLQRQNTRVEYNYDTGDNWIYWAGWMLEKGAIAHDWQPAPEDTNSQIEAVSSKIDQTASSITSTVNSTKQDLQGQINSANTKITQTANSITEQLKGYSKTGDMQNYVNTTVKKTADGINAKVSSVESKVNGIKIGGRNYLRDSDKSIFGWAQDLGTMPNEVLSSLAGETITVSVDTEWSNYQHSDSNQNRLGFELSVKGSDGKNYYFGAWKSPTTPSGKERVSTTYTLPANVTFTVGNNGQNGYVGINGTGKVSHAQIEIGNVAKDWQPAPEDTNSAIQTTKADLVQQITDAKNAAIKVSKDSITSEVSDVKTTITQVNNKVDNIQIGGGRNLLRISSFNGNTPNFVDVFNAHWHCGNNTTWTFSSDKPIISDDSQSLQFTPKSNLPNTDNGIWYIAPQVKAGEVYTFGFWGKSTSDGFKMEVESFSDLSTFTMTTAWKYYSGQLKFASDNRNMYFRISDSNSADVGTVTIFHPMLEKGTVAHEWSPSPQDIATDISNVNTKVEQYKTGIDQTATGINLFAQVITGNSSIDVTKSNIGIDPNQIKIASNKIVIDGNTIINGDVISANNIKSGGTIEGVGLTIKNGDHVTTVDDRGFIDYKNNNKTVISDGTFMSNRVSLSGELQTSEKTTVNGATQYQTVSVGNGHLTFALYPFDPTPDIQINTSSSSTSTSSSSTSTDNTDLPDTITMTSDPGVAVAGKELEGVGGKISASYGLPNLKTGTNDMTGLEILGQNISLTARGVADTIDASSIDKSIIDINNNAIKIGVLQNGGRGNASNIFIDNSGINLDTQWLTFDVTNMKVNGNAEFNSAYYTMFKPTGNQDALYVVSQKNSNSTQDYYAQTTLRAGSKYGTYGDSGLTFYWDSVKAFGTFDLRDTHVLGNRNTHFSVETTFDTDGEANMCFTWTSRSDLWNNLKLPMLARADWWTSPWGSCGILFANGSLFYVNNDGHTYKRLN